VNARLQDQLPKHGGQLRQIASRFGIAAERLVDFSANINPAGPPPAVQSAIRSALEAQSILATYPDLDLVELREAIAQYTGVQPENIAVANGFVPLLEASLRSLRIQRCLLPVPCFGEYRRTLENAGVATVPLSLKQNQGFAYGIDTMREALVNHSCDAILLANPQNPSGVLCKGEEILCLMKFAAQRNIAVLLDEAFIDYCPLDSLTLRSTEFAKIVIFRSVTKFFAIPGLRVAYAVGKISTIKAMNCFVAPWPITSFASIAACAALRDEPYAEKSRTANNRQRLWLEQELVRLRIATYPSSTNFLLLRFPEAVDVNLLWERMIVEEQVVMRSCTNFESLAPMHLRIAVRSQDENERLVRGLERVLSGLL
jgi:threonine-phosphate decarboxylase